MSAQEDKKTDKVAAVEVIEEDDEFEEFVQQDWDGKAASQEDTTLFEEDWDDTELDDNDFCNQLRTELAKQSK